MDAQRDLWYKNAILYAVDVHRFQDSNGDGRGDFPGLTSRLDYLADLGVTCLWLLPFYPTPYRDNGYDVTDYYDVDPRLGTLQDFLDFAQAAGERGIRLLADLVVDHTSDEHPWFEAARRDAGSRYRAYYVWADHPPPVPPDEGPIFPGEERSVWTFDEVAGAHYHHRFYHFEPDLNTFNPDVQGEIERILDFWFAMGISGVRIDAAPHMIDPHGNQADGHAINPHKILKDIRGYAEGRARAPALLGEVDVAPEKLVAYFGDDDELNLLFNFLLNNYLFLALAREDDDPIVRALKQIPNPPVSCQWANFIRNLDELDLERLTDEERQEVFDAFAPEEGMRIYGRGIRRRIAPMLGGDRRRMELVFSLLFSLPGVPLVIYGDEVGMGEDLEQQGRGAVRAPMPWANAPNAGFSDADPEVLPQRVIQGGPFGYEQVNVEDQRAAPDSFWHWMRALIYARRTCPEFGYGSWHTFDLDTDGVFAHRCTWKDRIVVALHNLTGEAKAVTLDLSDQQGRALECVLGGGPQRPLETGTFTAELGPYGYRWYRVTGDR